MKKINAVSFKGLIAEKLSISAKEAYRRVNESCNNFLKTQQGLQYLLLKYPKLSFSQAVLEYYYSVIIADNYDPTCQTEL